MKYPHQNHYKENHNEAKSPKVGRPFTLTLTPYLEIRFYKCITNKQHLEFILTALQVWKIACQMQIRAGRKKLISVFVLPLNGCE
jgi:hypothetical protein